MDAASTKFKTVDEYFSTFSGIPLERLEEIRATIRNAAPEAQEVISYNMPAFKYHGMLVYYAAWKEHIGLYALPSGNKAFMEELETYKVTKGAIQLPYKQPLPVDLITRIVQFRVQENLEKEVMKKSGKK